MLWTVEGTDIETGAPWATEIEAGSAELASELAGREGMQVAKVYPFKKTVEVDAEDASPQVGHPAVSGNPGENQAADEEHEYLGLSAGASVLNVLGPLMMVVGAMVLFGSEGTKKARLVWCVGSISFGILLLVVGRISLAVRDIARNSFRR